MSREIVAKGRFSFGTARDGGRYVDYTVREGKRGDRVSFTAEVDMGFMSNTSRVFRAAGDTPSDAALHLLVAIFGSTDFYGTAEC